MYQTLKKKLFNGFIGLYYTCNFIYQKEQSSEISLKNNLKDQNILNLYYTMIHVNQKATYFTILLLRLFFTFNNNNNF